MPGWTGRREGRLITLTREEDGASWCRMIDDSVWVPLWPQIGDP